METPRPCQFSPKNRQPEAALQDYQRSVIGTSDCRRNPSTEAWPLNRPMWYSRYTRWPASSLSSSTGASTRPKTDESISATQDPGISVRTGTDVSPTLTSMVLIVPSSYRQDMIVPSVRRLGPEKSTTRYPHSSTRSEPAIHIAQGKRRCDRPYAIRYRLSRTSLSHWATERGGHRRN